MLPSGLSKSLLCHIRFLYKRIMLGFTSVDWAKAFLYRLDFPGGEELGYAVEGRKTTEKKRDERVPDQPGACLSEGTVSSRESRLIWIPKAPFRLRFYNR